MSKSPRRSSLLTWPEIICVAVFLGVPLFGGMVGCELDRPVVAVAAGISDYIMAQVPSSSFVLSNWGNYDLMMLGGLIAVICALAFGLRRYPEQTSAFCCWFGLLLFLGATANLFSRWKTEYLTMGDFPKVLASSILSGERWGSYVRYVAAALELHMIAFGAVAVIGCFELQAAVRSRIVLHQPRVVRRLRLLEVFREGAMAKGRMFWLLLAGPILPIFGVVWFHYHAIIAGPIGRNLKSPRLLEGSSALQVGVFLSVEIPGETRLTINGIPFPGHHTESKALTARIWRSSLEARAKVPVRMMPDSNATHQDLIDATQTLEAIGFRNFYLID